MLPVKHAHQILNDSKFYNFKLQHRKERNNSLGLFSTNAWNNYKTKLEQKFPHIIRYNKTPYLKLISNLTNLDRTTEVQ
jgi:hypothetical protein